MKHFVEGFTKVHTHDVNFIAGIQRSIRVWIELEQLCTCKSAEQKIVLAGTENIIFISKLI